MSEPRVPTRRMRWSPTSKQLLWIIDQMPTGVLILDTLGRVLLRNATGRRIAGSNELGDSAATELQGYKVFDVETGVPLTSESSPVGAALAGRHIENFKYIFRRPGDLPDVTVEASYRPLLSEDGSLLGTVMTYADITREHALTQELAAQEAHLRLIYEAMPCGVIVHKPTADFVFANKAALELVGASSMEELVAMVRSCSYFNEDRGSSEASEWPVMRVVRTGQAERNATLRVTFPDGRVRWHRCDAVPLVRADGTIEEVVLIFVDITDERRAFEEQQRARAARQEERERIAMDLHDGVIQSLYALSLDLFSARNGFTPDQQAKLKKAEADIDGIIQAIRNYIFDLRPAPGVGKGLAAELRKLVGESMANSSVRWEVAVDPDVDELVAETGAAHLTHIVREVLSNVVRHAQATSVDVELRRSDQELVLRVRDDGAGFDAESSPHTGQGLRNIHMRALLMGAKLHVDSTPGGGTEVLLIMPGSPRPGGRAPSTSLLIVDDHELVRQGLRSLFGTEPGIEVVGEAETAAEGVLQAQRLHPDVVVLDVRLGPDSGIQACAEIVASCPGTKVVMLSGFHDEATVIAAVRAGAMAFVLKQNAGGELIEAVEHVASGRSLLDSTVTPALLERLRLT